MVEKKRKGLVLSGGGAYGAMSVGTLERMNKSYQEIVGVSTGALMSPLVALKQWDKLKEAYTSVNQYDILDKKAWYEPDTFRKDGKVSRFNLVWSQAKGDITAGTSKNLRNLIEKFITEEQYEEIKRKRVSLAVGAQNLGQSPSKVHYFDINDKNYSFEDFKDWMWASASPPIFFSLINKKWYDAEDDWWYNGVWTDGGLTESIALNYLANQRKCDEIDIFIHKPKTAPIKELREIKDLFHTAQRCYDAMRYDVELEQLPRIIKSLNNDGVSVRVIWLSRKLGTNSLIFNQKKMIEWYQEGYDTAFDEDRVEEFLV